MTDFMTREQRSRAMSRVRSSETQLEKLLRSGLHKRGFRFRKNVKGLPGRPDIVLPMYKAAVFVHGCFWHGHQQCPAANLPDTNRAFWEEKIGANVERDAHQHEELKNLGWRVAVVWGCSLKANSTQIITALAEWLVGTYKTIEL